MVRRSPPEHAHDRRRRPALGPVTGPGSHRQGRRPPRPVRRCRPAPFPIAVARARPSAPGRAHSLARVGEPHAPCRHVRPDGPAGTAPAPGPGCRPPPSCAGRHGPGGGAVAAASAPAGHARPAADPRRPSAGSGGDGTGPVGIAGAVGPPVAGHARRSARRRPRRPGPGSAGPGRAGLRPGPRMPGRSPRRPRAPPRRGDQPRPSPARRWASPSSLVSATPAAEPLDSRLLALEGMATDRLQAFDQRLRRLEILPVAVGRLQQDTARLSELGRATAASTRASAT